MKIAYILPVDMSNYNYSLSNFLNTHFSVKIAQKMANLNNEVILHAFWNRTMKFKFQNITVCLYKTNFNNLLKYNFSGVSIHLLNIKFPKETIIHFHEPNTLFFVPFILKNLSNIIIAENHGIGIINPYPLNSILYWIYGIIRRLIIPTLLHKCKIIIVHNDKAFINVNNYGISKNNIYKSLNGIDVTDYRLFNRNKSKKDLGLLNKKLIIFVGRITKSKGIRELVLAFRKLKKNNSKLDLAIIGPLEDADLKDQVKPFWKGFKVSNELQKWYCAADIFCLPSYGEGLSISVIEAMYYNLPIILTNVPGSKEISAYGCTYLCRARDYKDLHLTLKKVLITTVNKIKSRNNVLKFFTWDKICLKYLELYKK